MPTDDQARNWTSQGLPVGWSDSGLAQGTGGGCLPLIFRIVGITGGLALAAYLVGAITGLIFFDTLGSLFVIIRVVEWVVRRHFWRWLGGGRSHL